MSEWFRDCAATIMASVVLWPAAVIYAVAAQNGTAGIFLLVLLIALLIPSVIAMLWTRDQLIWWWRR